MGRSSRATPTRWRLRSANRPRRSASTHLVNLLAADTRFRSMPLWESYEPVPDPREVAAVFSAPLAAFLPDAPMPIVEREHGGRRYRYAAFPVEGREIWGATARILGQLGAVLGGD